MYDDEINELAKFLGVRDIQELNSEALQSTYGISQVDVMVLFGGSILAGGDVLAKAIKSSIAKHYVIVGGAGHTTDTLRHVVQNAYPNIKTQNLSEAEIFNQYIESKYQVTVDWLEIKSTNCGNNITNLLSLLEKQLPNWQSIILLQDATMQKRMTACLEKYVESDKVIINYATYQVLVKNNKIINPPLGMWSFNRYLNLLMGEIPRLEEYGPKGKQFIAEVSIPKSVIKAFNTLKKANLTDIRPANPKYSE